MIEILTRRNFVAGALSVGAFNALWPPVHPPPRVYQLAHWRSRRELVGLKHAFEFLESTPAEERPPGRIEIDGERMYAIVVRDKTRAAESAQFEAHRKYIDLHYLIRGREMIGSSTGKSLRVVKPYAPDSDVVLYERPREYERLLLTPGHFAVFFPGQAHMPGCFTERSEEITKAVVKILMR